MIIACVLGQVLLVGVGFEDFAAAQAGGAAEDNEVDQRVGAEAVRAMDGDACRFADGHQAGHDGVGIAGRLGEDFTVIVRGDAAHVVVHGRQDGDRLFREVDAGEDLCALRNAGEALVENLRVEVIEVQMDVIILRSDAAAFADFHRHRA